MPTSYTYNKSHKHAPAAQMFNFNYTEDGAVNIPTCLFDLTDYLGNTIRFYIAASSANGATEAGAVVPNDFDGWYQDVGNLDPYPQNLTMVDLTSGNDPEGYAQIIAKAINGAAGFGQYGGTMIAVTYGFDDNIHVRSITIDNGWKVLLGRGLDIWQKTGGWYDINEYVQSKRICKACEVTFVKN